MSTAHSIIRDAKVINNKLTALKKQGESYHTALHVMAVSVLVHAAEHGQVAPLNRFYGLLSTNYQTAFKLYVQRFQQRSTDDGDRVPTEYAFLKFEKGEFAVDTELPKGNRKKFQDLAEKHLINPDGEKVKRFYERNNLAEVKKFGDDQVITSLRNMVKSAKGEKDNVKPTVSDPVLKAISEALAKAEAVKEQLSA